MAEHVAVFELEFFLFERNIAADAQVMAVRAVFQNDDVRILRRIFQVEAVRVEQPLHQDDVALCLLDILPGAEGIDRAAQGAASEIEGKNDQEHPADLVVFDDKFHEFAAPFLLGILIAVFVVISVIVVHSILFSINASILVLSLQRLYDQNFSGSQQVQWGDISICVTPSSISSSALTPFRSRRGLPPG